MRAYAETFEIWDPTSFRRRGDWRHRGAAGPLPDEPALDRARPQPEWRNVRRAGFSGPYGTGISQLINGMASPEYIASLLERAIVRGTRMAPFESDPMESTTTCLSPRAVPAGDLLLLEVRQHPRVPGRLHQQWRPGALTAMGVDFADGARPITESESRTWPPPDVDGPSQAERAQGSGPDGLIFSTVCGCSTLRKADLGAQQ